MVSPEETVKMTKTAATMAQGRERGARMAASMP
jgi:hypothetical protein